MGPHRTSKRQKNCRLQVGLQAEAQEDETGSIRRGELGHPHPSLKFDSAMFVGKLRSNGRLTLLKYAWEKLTVGKVA
jgi:hypothetical protein